MIYRLFGKTGLKVSIFSLGSWVTFDKSMRQEDVNKVVSSAFENGINLLDTAEVYGEGKVETIIGNSLKNLKSSRDQFLLCTKVFWGGPHWTQIGLHRKHIIEGCNNSLIRLGVDYVDFYLCHRPDPNTPLDEVIIAMNILIQQGKIFYWGTSEWPAELINEASLRAKNMNLIGPSVDQSEYNLFHRDREYKLEKLSNTVGVANMITMPLANGILAGRYNNGHPDNSRATLSAHSYLKNKLQSPEGKIMLTKAKELSLIADRFEMTQAQLALVWCLLNTNIHTTILGVSRLEQLQENLNILPSIENELKTKDIYHSVEEIFPYQPKVNTVFNYNDVIKDS